MKIGLKSETEILRHTLLKTTLEANFNGLNKHTIFSLQNQMSSSCEVQNKACKFWNSYETTHSNIQTLGFSKLSINPIRLGGSSLARIPDSQLSFRTLSSYDA